MIYKLLYFMDFNFYEKYEEQLIGAGCIKNHYGPGPTEFKKVLGAMIAKEKVVKVESKYFDYPQTKYLPLRKPALSKLGAHEIEGDEYRDEEDDDKQLNQGEPPSLS